MLGVKKRRKKNQHWHKRISGLIRRPLKAMLVVVGERR